MNDSTPRGAFNESAPFDTRPLTTQPLSFDPEGTIEVPSGHDTEVFAQTIRDIEQPTAAPKPGEFQRDVVDEVTPEQPRREVWEDAARSRYRSIIANIMKSGEREHDAMCVVGCYWLHIREIASAAVATQSAELERVKAELAAVREKAQALRDYIVETPVVGFDVPDDIWIPFDALLKEKP